MGKDREGKFHPQKGKPSGSGKEEGIGLQTANTARLKDYIEISEKYATDDANSSELVTRHPNRTNEKKPDRPSASSTRTTKKSKDTTELNSVDEKDPFVWDTLNRRLFGELAEFKSAVSVSIYMPSHTHGVEVNEQSDNLSFKNELQIVSGDLDAKGFSKDQIHRILQPAKDFLENHTAWRTLSNGIAVFLADGFSRFIKLPFSPVRETVVNSRFIVSPLVPVVTGEEYFFLLLLSKKQARLFKIDSFSLQHIPMKELPNGIEDVVHLEEKEDQQLWRTGSSGAGGGANYHGIGGGKPDEKENIAMYFDEVDETLWKEVLHGENVPLLLAGVDYLIPIYRQVSQYKNIFPEALVGNFDRESNGNLFSLSREKMTAYLQERGKNALENYRNHKGTSLVSSQLSDVIPAAHYGRVLNLFVQPGEHVWGKFDEMQNDLQLSNEPGTDHECLLNRAIIKTIMTGGEVFFVSKDEMPDQSKVAALMRY